MQSSVITTRGHDFKLYKKVTEYDIQKYMHSFTARIVDLWNCFPKCEIKSPSVYSFRRNLHKFWCSQDVAKWLFPKFQGRKTAIPPTDQNDALPLSYPSMPVTAIDDQSITTVADVHSVPSSQKVCL